MPTGGGWNAPGAGGGCCHGAPPVGGGACCHGTAGCC